MQSVGLQGFREDRFRKVIETILKHRTNWDQTDWHLMGPDIRWNKAPTKITGTECGTAHCFAGWCDILSGQLNKKAAEYRREFPKEELSFYTLFNLGDVESDALNWLGFMGWYDGDAGDIAMYTEWDHLSVGADCLTKPNNTIEDIILWFYNAVSDRLGISLERIKQGKSTTADRRLRIRCRLVQNDAERRWHKALQKRVFSVNGPRLDIPVKYINTKLLSAVLGKKTYEETIDLQNHSDPVVRFVATAALKLFYKKTGVRNDHKD